MQFRLFLLLLISVSLNRIDVDATDIELHELQNLANNHNISAQFELATQLYDRGPDEHIRALAWFQIAAKNNNPDAMLRVASMFRKGEGTARDPIMAYSWAEKASAHNVPSAFFLMGDMLREGEVDISYSEEKCFEAFQKGAVLGDKSCYAALGWCYRKGFGVEVNKEKAKSLISYSVADSNPEGIFELGMFSYYDDEMFMGNVNMAKSYLTSAYNKGVLKSLHFLGMIYLGEQMHEDAFGAFQLASEKGYVPSQYQLGKLYLEGTKTCPVDLDKAIMWLSKSSFDLEASDDLAIAFFKKGRFSESFELFQKSKSGKAKYYLWLHYSQGLGVAHNDVYALHFFNDALGAGDALALSALGTFQFNGENNYVKSLDEACRYWNMSAERGDGNAMYSLTLHCSLEIEVKVKWLTKAAHLGHTLALHELGLAYFHGDLNLDRNYYSALYFLEWAAEQGHIPTQVFLGKCHFFGVVSGHSHADAFGYAMCAAKEGNAEAMTLLGHLYYKGSDTEANQTLALEWWEKGALLGNNPNDMFHLAKYYLDELKANETIGMSWLTKSVEGNHLEAQLYLANLYFQGVRLPKNDVKGVSLVLDAAEKGSVEASLWTALCYDKGFGVRRNTTEALRWANLVTSDFYKYLIQHDPLPAFHQDSVHSEETPINDSPPSIQDAKESGIITLLLIVIGCLALIILVLIVVIVRQSYRKKIVAEK